MAWGVTVQWEKHLENQREVNNESNHKKIYQREDEFDNAMNIDTTSKETNRNIVPLAPPSPNTINAINDVS